MTTALRAAVRAVGAALLAVTLAGGNASAQTGEREFARAWDGRPDLNGIWQAIGTAHWDIQDHPASAGPPEFGAVGRAVTLRDGSRLFAGSPRRGAAPEDRDRDE